MKLSLPEGNFKAYLFDCDGTIVDSMPLHYVAWKQALAEHGCTDFSEELFYSMGGMPVADVVARLNQRDGTGLPNNSRGKTGIDYTEINCDAQRNPNQHRHSQHGCRADVACICMGIEMHLPSTFIRANAPIHAMLSTYAAREQ